jgi:hypothetical protein
MWRRNVVMWDRPALGVPTPWRRSTLRHWMTPVVLSWENVKRCPVKAISPVPQSSPTSTAHTETAISCSYTHHLRQRHHFVCRVILAINSDYFPIQYWRFVFLMETPYVFYEVRTELQILFRWTSRCKELQGWQWRGFKIPLVYKMFNDVGCIKLWEWSEIKFLDENCRTAYSRQTIM